MPHDHFVFVCSFLSFSEEKEIESELILLCKYVDF